MKNQITPRKWEDVLKDARETILIGPEFISDVKPETWSRLIWEILIGAAYDSRVFGAYVEALKCKRCKRTLNGALFILKENMSILDTWNFMVFGEDIVCDLCLGENSWILHAYLMLEKNNPPRTIVEDLPDRTVNYMSLSDWQKLLKKHKRPELLPFIVSGFRCDTCGRRVQGVLFINPDRGIDVVDTWGFRIGEKVECCLCGGFADWISKI
ncbi:MAG: hypothetical protein QXI12_02175 [Candidatus Methanomethyliaceae archaeon]